MADLKLEHIYKVYPNGVKAVNDFTMNIKDCEFIVFVGPSGCGKSTTLRMIAGLEDITAGELYIGDQIVNDMEPKDRDIAMVFQNYALYPHMTVYDNMAFGLKLRHLPNDVIHEKVMWAAEVLGLKEYLDRKPKAMSGGQRQRVALGRAILRNPKVMLLDEPLSNLDAKLRSQMRSEISKLHQKLKTTFIYVTHDQVEAMTLGTRVVVMKLGRIQQIDTPKNLYDYPENKFVAGFIGTPQMNFFEEKKKKKDDKVVVKFEYTENELVLPFRDLIKVKSSYLDGKTKVTVGLRCEDISVEPDVIAAHKDLVDVRVSHFEELGNETLIYGDLNMQGEGFDETATRVIIKATSRHNLKTGDIVKAYMNMKKAHLFDINTEMTIKPRIPTDNLVNVSVKDNVLTLCKEKLVLPKAISIKEFSGDILIPAEAIKITKEGVNAKVSDIEVIDKTQLVYLEINGQTLFTTSDLNLKVGQEICVELDFSLINLGDNKRVDDFDEFKANFYNYETAYDETSDQDFANLKASRENEVAAKFDKLIEEENVRFNNELAEANKINYVDVKAKNDATLQALKASSNEKIKELKAKYKADLSVIKREHSANVKEIKLKINDIYAKRVADENEDYKNVLATNKDRDVIILRKADHTLFKENLPKEKANDLENKLNAEGFDFDAKKSAITGAYKRELNNIRNNLKEETKKFERENNLVNVLTKEHEAKLKELNAKKVSEVNKAGLLFFFKLQGNEKTYFVSPDVITNKLIQGVGSKVFSKVYIINVPHNAYKLDEKGFEVVPLKVLDYKLRKFVECEVKETKKHIFIETKENLIDKDTIKVSLDLEKTQIIESGLNIRLY